MAKAKARRRVRDTWKEKSWYTIKTPVNFEDKEIGETPAKDPELLIGRGVEVTMRELTGDFSKQYIKLRFEIDNVAGEVANTKFTGHKTTTDYVRSMIRRGTSRIDASTIATTKDGRKIKLQVLAVTVRRAKSSQQKYMRKVIEDLLNEAAAEKSFDELIKVVVNGKLASEIYHNAKKIYPLKRVEIIKSKVIK
ncbi:small subunit ribosomal protein S3Ae [Methanobrevibacter gottschalkii]|uniref:Small ribosomal subunit protein eS1 n=2 Tax=Methanobrevibacter gottschalkii TaxID=190974 RepID=A0A3N5B5W4_9EURY|nr:MULTISPECIES: 30S ribosomal protein S3ae [Methanobrevibacter]MCQ2971367.1 30S ribosomal protein S3ae [archaeon]OEC97851.1 30S ribosomal protein S3ae [Methanobrevibacter sp. A27]RPF53056.1 SSU ribosomal protein S3AE [Methanobrevibacter gottschalkii DSM 11977]SEK55866.1 small subunit ribosomal protein S3Ae [Methanobrevibacter gottschalkii]